MGWTFFKHLGYSAKGALIAALTKDEVNQLSGTARKLVKQRLGKKTTDNQPLWTVWGHIGADGAVTRFIGCDLLCFDKQSGLGYKSLDESTHPFYYDCPLEFLRITPIKCQAWRDEVVKYHTHREKQKKLCASIKPGALLDFEGLSIQTGIFEFYHKRSMAIRTDKGLMKLAPKFFDRIIGVRYTAS